MKYPIGTIFCYHGINCPPTYWKFCIIIGHKSNSYSVKWIRYNGSTAKYLLEVNSVNRWTEDCKGIILKIA